MCVNTYNRLNVVNTINRVDTLNRMTICCLCLFMAVCLGQKQQKGMKLLQKHPNFRYLFMLFMVYTPAVKTSWNFCIDGQAI